MRGKAAGSSSVSGAPEIGRMAPGAPPEIGAPEIGAPEGGVLGGDESAGRVLGVAASVIADVGAERANGTATCAEASSCGPSVAAAAVPSDAVATLRSVARAAALLDCVLVVVPRERFFLRPFVDFHAVGASSDVAAVACGAESGLAMFAAAVAVL